MIKIDVKYDKWKQITLDKKLKYFSCDQGIFKSLFSLDGPICYECSTVDSVEIGDFEISFEQNNEKSILDEFLFIGEGQKVNVSVGITVIRFAVKNDCLFDGVQFIGSNLLDNATLTVNNGDTVVTTFGENWNFCEGNHKEILPYRASLKEGMDIVISYNSASEKEIGINYYLHKAI